jgi:hypothetical protein
MKKNISRGVVRALALSLATAMMICTAALTARAACCLTYDVEILASVPAGCFPMGVATSWGGGLAGGGLYPGPGVYTEPVPVGWPCWGNFQSIRINGVLVNPTGPCPQPVVLPCGTVNICLSPGPGGCLKFTIS